METLLGVRTYLKLAGGEGIGPSLWDSKSHVLPLDDPPIVTHTLNPAIKVEKHKTSIDLLLKNLSTAISWILTTTGQKFLKIPLVLFKIFAFVSLKIQEFRYENF